MIAAIRLRGSTKARHDSKATLALLGLKRVNTLVILKDNKITMGMIKRVEDYIAWGPVPESSDFKNKRLKPPKGGFVSIKNRYPNGDLGYRKDMDKLIKRMM